MFLVVLTQLVERAEARVFAFERVVFHPPSAGVEVEVLARSNRGVHVRKVESHGIVVFLSWCACGHGEKYHGLYSFALISNANRIAGIDNFYHNVKLDDNQFEVAFCNLQAKKDIVRSLIYLKLNDITKVPGFYFHKTDHLKIKFHEKLKKPWCLDGEVFECPDDIYDIKIERGVSMVVSKSVIKTMFVEKEK